MTSRDIFQALNDQDAATLEMVVARMEMRARDPRFVLMRGDYLDRLDMANVGSFLDLGCGTGIDARAAAKRPEFKGRAVGVDVSEGMIEAGRRLAAEEGGAARVDLRVGDAAAVPLPDASFDAIVMHTLVSHLKEPAAVLREARRLLAPEGRLVVFDADFASLSFGYPDADVARAMEEALLATFVANPRIMRDLPRLVGDCGLAIADAQASILADVGTSAFFPGMIDNYAPLVSRFGLLDAAVVDAWIEEQRRSMAEGRFFGSLSFYAYLLRR